MLLEFNNSSVLDAIFLPIPDIHKLKQYCETICLILSWTVVVLTECWTKLKTMFSYSKFNLNSKYERRSFLLIS